MAFAPLPEMDDITIISSDMELQILILTPDEKVIGYLNPDIVDINEINEYAGLKQLSISHPIKDDSTYDYDTLLKHGNKIWRNKTSDGDACLYVLNTEKVRDEDNFKIDAEEVLVELNDAGVVERSSSSPITINTTNLNTWFGQYFTIGTFETPLRKNTVTFTGTLTRMMLLRLIEEETGNVFVTRYEKDADTNIIHRYLDFKQSFGVEHTTPIEVGENTDKIEISIDESDTHRSIVPIIKDTESSGAVEDTVKTSQVMADFKALSVSVGQSIPMIIEKKQDGQEVVTAYWNAPFQKVAGAYEVFLAPGAISSNYNNIYFKESPTGGVGVGYMRKQGTVETSETNKYVIYNLCALKLMDKKDPVINIEAEIHDLYELPGGNIPYNVGDTVHIRLPGSTSLITSKVIKTTKDPRENGKSKIEIGNAVSGGTVSRSDINRPAGLDSLTLSKIYADIPTLAEGKINALAPGIADGRINALTPGIANTQINNNVPGLIFDQFQNSTNTGQITFHNGLCIQWGIVQWSNPAADTLYQTTITFVYPFTHQPGIITSHNTARTGCVSASTSLSTTSVIINFRSPVAFTGTAVVRWIAIGKRQGY